MRIAHLADAHLGFRQFHRQTPSGINQREADVAHAFRSAVDGVLAERPDAVLIAGDLFHAVRPTNHSIVFAFRQLQRLREGLGPATPIVLIAGNHDTPRSAETGTILRLFEELDVRVAEAEPRRLSFPQLGLSVLAVPHQALAGPDRVALEPAGPEPYQVLVLHGEVEGMFPFDRSALEYGGAILRAGELHLGEWSYVALGHYHVSCEVWPRAWYAGALEYVSPNPWGELADERQRGVPGKGWLLVDLATGAVERRPVRAARRLLDLPPLDATGMDAAQVDAAIRARVDGAPDGIADHVVRLVVHNIPRPVGRELDHAAIRGWKAEALSFHLDLRRPEPQRTVGVGAPGRRQTLPELVRDYLSRRPLPATLDRDAFVALGAGLMDDVERQAAG